MHGIGNDFVLIDGFTFEVGNLDWFKLAPKICARHFGVGADGVILLRQGDHAPLRMEMFNPDGSEAEMCGNGIRCLARFAESLGRFSGSQVAIETKSGVKVAELLPNGQVRIDMGRGDLSRGASHMTGVPEDWCLEQPFEADGKTWLGSVCSTGNPHLVVFSDDVANLPLESVGPALERHPSFLERVNVHFAQVLSPSHVLQRTWERGAGITLGCGTGACAVAVIATELGRGESPVRVSLPGGDLIIEVDLDRNIRMIGPAETVYEGELDLRTTE